VKNLENVQGDERDVIVFSPGHAPAERALRNGPREQYVPARFGPLGQRGGERRLNVAVSRARMETVIVASFEPAMLSVGSASNEGPRLFKAFLEYAWHLSRGERLEAERVLDRVRSQSRSTARPALRTDARGDRGVALAVQVAEALRARGFACETNVGTSEFRVPVAVIDPVDARRYRVAVWCEEGVSHVGVFEAHAHRRAVLEARGWRFVHVTARDWWKRRAWVLDAVTRAIQSSD
jgi:hypothetical protein